MNNHTLNIIIREEVSSDVDAIYNVTVAAFENQPISMHTEQYIVNALRGANVLSISLVAVLDGAVVGHIALSPITLPDSGSGWYGLGPISVLPQYQRQGIGSALMREGLARLKAMGASGCVLVGDPEYYKRFGFRSYAELNHEGVPQEFVLALPFTNVKPAGIAVFHEAFGATQ